MMVERYPNLKDEVGGSIPGCEISSLLGIILAMWSTASCALVMACRPSVFRMIIITIMIIVVEQVVQIRSNKNRGIVKVEMMDHGYVSHGHVTCQNLNNYSRKLRCKERETKVDTLVKKCQTCGNKDQNVNKRFVVAIATSLMLPLHQGHLGASCEPSSVRYMDIKHFKGDNMDNHLVRTHLMIVKPLVRITSKSHANLMCLLGDLA